MRSDTTGRRPLIGALLALAALLVAPLRLDAAPSAEAARNLVDEVGNRVLGILQDEDLSDRQKFDRLVEVLEGPIDLDLIARLILGRHWRTASEAQQERYLRLFREYALAYIASRLHLYQGQEFEITGAQEVSERDAMVSTRITGTEGPPLNVNWRLREARSGDLMAIDVVVEGVSLLVSQRSEFGSVIERRGMDGLLAELERRIEANRA